MFWLRVVRFVGTRGLQILAASSEGPEGAAWQAALKEAVVAKKKKRAEKVRRRHEKEKEITWWVQAGEN